MEFDLPTVDRLLTTTRAVRRRLDLARPVPPEVIATCLDLALQAPTAADEQNWRFLVVTDAGTRQAIADLHRSGSETFVRRELERLADSPGPERRRMESVIHLIEHFHEVPVHVIAYVLEPQLDGLGDQPLPPVLLYGSVFPAVWSFQLALRSRGLGTTPLFVGDEAALAEIVGAPPGAHVASLLPVAYTIGTDFKAAPRRPLSDVVFRDSWGTPL